MRKFFTLLLCLITFSHLSIAQKKIKKTKTETYDSNTEIEIQSMGVGLQGTSLFKVYSYGNNEDECIEFAKMNAIKAIIFRGIPGSDAEQPMVTDAGAEEKYRDYFTAFFKKGGKYKSFVSISTDGSINAEDRIRVGSKLKVGIVVSVQKEALRRELENAKIIGKLGDGL